MSLSVGIVGLPNAGKSTLFNALLRKQKANVASHPFTTIDPNVGIVPVPDTRLNLLHAFALEEYKSSNPKRVPAEVKFIDIAGLVEGAHEGEGLGNQFLAQIREVDVILHVVRDFTDARVARSGSVSPLEDLKVVNTELILKDVETIEKMLSSRKGKLEAREEIRILNEILNALNSKGMLYWAGLCDEAFEFADRLQLLTAKPQIVVFNVDESAVSSPALPVDVEGPSVSLCAKIEEELSGFSKEEQKQYLEELGVAESGLDKVVKMCYRLLGLWSFYTVGEKEARAWSFLKGSTAVQCAGVIHSDFEKKFIALDAVYWEDFIKYKGWVGCRNAGKVRLEGRGYAVQDGDVLFFRVGR